MADALIERLDTVTRTFAKALMLGADPVLFKALEARGIKVTAFPGDEDQLDVDASCDLIVSIGALDTVQDLPGALLLARRALLPDGLFLASFVGAPSFPMLRAISASADARAGIAVQRVHPQIAVATGGDLLVRAGFALPVADIDTMEIAYSSFMRLIGDLRVAGATNMLRDRYPVGRDWLRAAVAAFEDHALPDGRTRETISVITLTGWAPAPSQPQPARRGSGRVSLIDALRPSS